MTPPCMGIMDKKDRRCRSTCGLAQQTFPTRGRLKMLMR